MVTMDGGSLLGSFLVFSTSVVGADHLLNEKKCQDSSMHFTGDGFILAVVCDGHGGDEYFRSDIGSLLAAQAAVDSLTHIPFLSALKNSVISENAVKQEAIILQVKKSIIARWNELISAHFEENPFAEDELEAVPEKAKREYEKGEAFERAYGTTLIASLLTETGWLGLQIGDGNCVVIDHCGIYTQPIKIDEECFLNTTTSICDKNAINKFYHAFIAKLPNAVFIGTDGIDNCFAGSQGLFDFYKRVKHQFVTLSDTFHGFDEAKLELQDYLPRLSQKGSGDDISIGLILRKKKFKDC